jgi:septum formation protein
MENTNHESALILASRSPRRKYLLEQAGLSFSVVPSEFDESLVSLRGPENYVRKLAEKKAGEVSSRYPNSWVLGADTVVVIDHAILGKPKSVQDAKEMLARLSGRTHQVFTGFCIRNLSIERCFSHVVKTDVRFKKLDAAEIEWYIHTPEPFDKAGAYAIQGIGTFLVRSISGSYTNVVGLPVCEVVEFLIKEGVVGFRKNGRLEGRDSGGERP